ncbi:MAG: hypothetical protein ACJAT2_000993 [Bacteriovoracaceae bacterium]|jgi:hypothetical protein
MNEKPILTNLSFHKFCLSLLGLIFILKLIETFCFINYIDPFCYHLAFAKIWYETSFIEAMRDNDLFLFSGYFDFLYIIPMYISKGDYFLAQKLGQVTHFILSLGLGSFLLFRYFNNKTWAILSAISLLTISKSSTFFLVAKNDGGLSLAILFCYILIFDNKFLKVSGLKRAMFIGAIVGMIPAIKLNGLCYAVPLALYYILKNRSEYKKLFYFCLFGLLVFSPVLIKNWYFIKSPFFPALLTIFPGESSEVMINFYTKFLGAKFEWSLLVEHLNYFLLGKVLLALTPFVFIFKIVKKDKFSVDSNYCAFIISLLSYLLYIKVNGGIPTPRYIFPCYFLLIFFLFHELDNRLEGLNQNRLVPFLLLLLILADSKLDKSIKRISTSYKNRKEDWKVTVNNGFRYSKFWNFIEATEASTKSYIVSDYLTNSYYAPKGIRVRAGMMDREASFIYSCKDLSKLSQFDYALLQDENSNKCYRKIKKEGKLLHKEGLITLYDLRGLRY